MAGLIILLAVLVAIIVFDILAQTHGVDSRPDFEDPRAPVRGIST
jgi:hypothetical protein